MHSGGKHWLGLGPGLEGEVKEQLGGPWAAQGVLFAASRNNPSMLCQERIVLSMTSQGSAAMPAVGYRGEQAG